jgi:hypothetical protein
MTTADAGMTRPLINRSASATFATKVFPKTIIFLVKIKLITLNAHSFGTAACI